MKFLEFVISHARATIAIMLLIVVTGAGSRLSMPVELSPNVVLPVVMTMVRYDGISPEDGNYVISFESLIDSSSTVDSFLFSRTSFIFADNSISFSLN